MRQRSASSSTPAPLPHLVPPAVFVIAALAATGAVADCPVGLDAAYGDAGIAFHDFGEPVVLGGSHRRPDGSLLLAVERTSGPTFAIEEFDAAGTFSVSPFYAVPATMTARDVAAGLGGASSVTFAGEMIDAGLPDILVVCLDDAGALDTTACPPAGFMARSVDEDVRVTRHDAVNGCAYAVGRGDVDGFGDDIALAYRLCPIGGGGFSWSQNFYVANGETTAIFNDQDLFASTASFGPWPSPIEPAVVGTGRAPEPNGSAQLFRWQVGTSGTKGVLCLYLHDDVLVGCRKIEGFDFLAVETARNGDAIVLLKFGDSYGLARYSAESGEGIDLIPLGATGAQFGMLFPDELDHLYDELCLLRSSLALLQSPGGPAAAIEESEACVDQIFEGVSRTICPFEGAAGVDSDTAIEIHTVAVEGTDVPCTDNLIVATTDDGQGIAVAKLRLPALVVFNEDHESGGFGGWTAVVP